MSSEVDAFLERNKLRNPIDKDKSLAYNEGRTYDHNGHVDMDLGMPQYSDEEIAHMTRMLMRDDLYHEGIVTTARDRILCLLKEKAQLEAEVARLKGSA